MKTTTDIEIEDDLLDNYDFDFSESQPNRFASELKKQNNFVELDSDVAKYFKTSEQVNKALRAILLAYPKKHSKLAKAL